MTPGAGWLSAAEAARYLGLPSTAALCKRVERGQVPAHRWGRLWRFRRSELDALMGPSAVVPSAASAVAGQE
jgi:excisionase family DNA binding protein